MQIRDDDSLAAAVGQLLLEREARVATAETTAGGLISARILSVPGASRWFNRAVVAYTGTSKQESLGVDPAIISEHGSVSAVTVEAMATSLRELAGVEYCVAESGMAGPQTGRRSPKPVGSVVIAVAGPGGVISEEQLFEGGRVAIMEQIAERALAFLEECLREGRVS